MKRKKQRSLFLLVTFTITSSLVSTRAAYAETNLNNSFKKLFSGIASWYGGKFHGRRTASGTKYNMHAMTCAHKTLPFGTKLLVKNKTNGKTCQVTVTDRGPYYGKRVIDLSKAAADKLGMDGISNVVCYLAKAVTKGIGETAKGISGTAKEAGETVANLPGNSGKVAKEFHETALDVKSRGLPVASKPMSKQAYRKQIERYYAERTLSFEANEIGNGLQFQGSFEPRAKTGCLLIPDGGITDRNRHTASVLAGLEQEIY